jgi:hypothetical protein
MEVSGSKDRLTFGISGSLGVQRFRVETDAVFWRLESQQRELTFERLWRPKICAGFYRRWTFERFASCVPLGNEVKKERGKVGEGEVLV